MHVSSPRSPRRLPLSFSTIEIVIKNPEEGEEGERESGGGGGSAGDPPALLFSYALHL
jgi:hypothetical protein